MLVSSAQTTNNSGRFKPDNLEPELWIDRIDDTLRWDEIFHLIRSSSIRINQRVLLASNIKIVFIRDDHQNLKFLSEQIEKGLERLLGTSIQIVALITFDALELIYH